MSSFTHCQFNGYTINRWCCFPFVMKVTFCHVLDFQRRFYTVCIIQAWIPVVKVFYLIRAPSRHSLTLSGSSNSIQFNSVDANDPHIVIDKHSVTTATQWIWQSAAYKKLSIVHFEASSLHPRCVRVPVPVFLYTPQLTVFWTPCTGNNTTLKNNERL